MALPEIHICISPLKWGDSLESCVGDSGWKDPGGDQGTVHQSLGEVETLSPVKVKQKDKNLKLIMPTLYFTLRYQL